MRRLIGFIPMPHSIMPSFGIPVYQNETGAYEFHKLSEDSKSIVDFHEIPEKPKHMIPLPGFLQNEIIEIGNSSLFVIVTPTLLFVGDAKDLAIHADGIRKIGGENFVKELNLIVPSQQK